jgi:Na+-transporting methylmalonyl-CoA/oxaloacetate decarboxylase gamma subunit
LNHRILQRPDPKREQDVIALWIGAQLTLYGMGLVFLLLAVLWGLIALLIRLDRPAAGSAEPSIEADIAALSGAGANADVVMSSDAAALDPEVLAAVVIACRAHRMSRRRQAAPEMRTHQPGTLPSRWVGTGRTRQNRSWAPGGRYA